MDLSIFGDLDFGSAKQRSPKPLPPPKPHLPDCVRPRKPLAGDPLHGCKVHSNVDVQAGAKRGRGEVPDQLAKKGKDARIKLPPMSPGREVASDQIILVPSGASQKRLQLRKAIRSELESCHSLESLQEAINSALSVMRKGSSLEGKTGSRKGSKVAWQRWQEKQGQPVAKLVQEALWRYKPGVLHDVWRDALQQVVGQEVQRRQDVLATIDPRSQKDASPRSTLQPPQVTRVRRKALLQVGAPRDDSNQPDFSVTKQAELLRLDNSQREKHWKSAFCRLSQAFRLRYEDILRALELAGIPYPRPDWAEESYNSTTSLGSLTSEEFIKFVAGYMSRQDEEQKAIFNEYDDDRSGSIDTKELERVVRSMGMEPLEHVLEDVIKDVDRDNSGNLNFAEFEVFMESIVICEGFSRQERNNLWQVFRRFDKAGVGHIAVEILHGALGWLGHSLTTTEVWEILEQVDVDHSGNIDFHEFLVCMRKFRELEVESLKRAIRVHDEDESGTASLAEVEQILRSMGYIPDQEAVADAVRDAGVGQELTLSDLWKFLQVYRDREGLSVAELAEVDETFARYIDEDEEEISALNVGKALRWFGYQVSFPMQQQLASKVDLDHSGRISLSELRKLIRMYWEGELQKMQDAFAAEDVDKTGTIDKAQVEQAFRCCDFVDGSRQTPSMPPGKDTLDLQGFLSVGTAFKKEQRDIFRENGGFSEAEVARMRKTFDEFDTDKSGSIGVSELGALIRTMFPVMTRNVRPKLDMLMKEVAATGNLNFADFVLTMRQFYDIQTQERLDKEAQLVAETGFTPHEVQGFRELFQKSDENWDQELSLIEVKHMIENVCPLGDRNMEELVTIYKEVRKEQEAKNKKMNGHEDNVDFPEFLLLMRKLLDRNFANIQDRLKVYDANKRTAMIHRQSSGHLVDIKKDKCQNCGSMILPDATFCRSCRKGLSKKSVFGQQASLNDKEVAMLKTSSRRASVPDAETCECGNRFMPDSKFCRRCGTKRGSTQEMG